MGEDPFKSQTPPRWPKLLAVAVVLGVVGVGASLLLKRLSSAPPDLRPPSLTAALLETDWDLPARDGIRRFAHALEAPTSLVAIGRDGSLALASGERPDEVLVWRAGAWRAHVLEGARGITALAIDPEGRTHIGTRGGRIARVDTDGSLWTSEAPVSDGNTVVGFTFDPGSDRAGVMISGGEVFKGVRPMVPEALEAVAMPSGTRVRVMGIDADGELVVAGDAGAIYVSSSSGWDHRPTAVHRAVTVLGNDAIGRLLAAQQSGHVFAADGYDWEPLGEIGVAPVALGEHPTHGLVVLGVNGSVWKQEGAGFRELEPLLLETVTAAVVRGANVAVVAGGELVTSDLSEPQTLFRQSALETLPPCRPLTFEAPALPLRVRCAEQVFAVSADAMTPSDPPEGWSMPLLEQLGDRSLVLSRWRGDELWISRTARRRRWAESSELARASSDQRLREVARFDAPQGPVHGFDVGDDAVWLAFRDGSLGRSALDPVDVETLVEHDTFLEQLPETGVDDFRVIAGGDSAWAIHVTVRGEWRMTPVDADGTLGETRPMPGGSLFHLGDRTFVLSSTGLHELGEEGFEQRPLAGVEPALPFVGTAARVRVRGDWFAFLAPSPYLCSLDGCRALDARSIRHVAPTGDGGAVMLDTDGRVLHAEAP